MQIGVKQRSMHRKWEQDRYAWILRNEDRYAWILRNEDRYAWILRNEDITLCPPSLIYAREMNLE